MPNLLGRMRGRLRDLVRALLRRLASAAGCDLVVRTYYSPIPDVSALPTDLWSSPREVPGVSIDVEAQLAFFEAELLPYLTEFDPPVSPEDSHGGYYLGNPFYGPVDAHALYCMIRHYKPARVMELGSGYSTRIIAQALARNRADGSLGEHQVFDPYMGDHGIATSGSDTVRSIPATEIPIDEFLALAEDDVLFVDTTHTVRVGGDVNRLLLEAIPRLSPGVVIHIHDVFLPWEYPKIWLTTFRRFWTEQYLLQALLCENACLSVLFGCHACARSAPDRFGEWIASFDPASLSPPADATDLVSPSGFWMRRTSGGDQQR
jgi:hypothetical protein